MRHSIGGFFVGADTPISDNAVLGVTGGYSHSDFRIRGRSTNADSDNFTAAAYGGFRLGVLSFRAGGAFTWHDVDTTRSISYPGFSDRLSSDYTARTGQIFGEVAYDLGFNRLALSPFARLAYVHNHSNTFTERGGAAALTVPSSSDDIGVSMIGVRVASGMSLANGVFLSARGTLGWRHAFGGTVPSATVAFASTNAPFEVTGLPVTRNSAVIEVGVSAAIAPALSIGVAYNGQISDRTQDHSVRGALTWNF